MSTVNPNMCNKGSSAWPSVGIREPLTRRNNEECTHQCLDLWRTAPCHLCSHMSCLLTAALHLRRYTTIHDKVWKGQTRAHDVGYDTCTTTHCTPPRNATPWEPAAQHNSPAFTTLILEFSSPFQSSVRQLHCLFTQKRACPVPPKSALPSLESVRWRCGGSMKPP